VDRDERSPVLSVRLEVEGDDVADEAEEDE
jgi:hypothetical protein